MNPTPNPQKPLKDTLFERIDEEKVCPRSKWWFRSRECLVWFLWLVSVVVGALAVAISLFVLQHHQYAFYEITHNNIFTFLVEVLPFLWFAIFGTMVFVAIYNLRHTAYGYRHPVWFILSSSLLLSFFIGLVLQIFGFGYVVDKILGDNMEMYVSQEKLEKRMWQEPAEGRLVGRQVFGTSIPTTTIIFEDIKGQRWHMNVSDLYQEEIDLLKEGGTLRLIGKPLRSDLFIFHACGAFPWVNGKKSMIDDMGHERKMFVDRLSKHVKTDQNLLMTSEGAPLSSTTLVRESPCSSLPVVRRIPVS